MDDVDWIMLESLSTPRLAGAGLWGVVYDRIFPLFCMHGEGYIGIFL